MAVDGGGRRVEVEVASHGQTSHLERPLIRSGS